MDCVCAKIVMPTNLRASGFGPGAQTFPSFQSLLEEAFYFFFFHPVCDTNAIFNECYNVEKFEKPCCIIYMVDGGVSGSIGNYSIYNDKYINVSL